MGAIVVVVVELVAMGTAVVDVDASGATTASSTEPPDGEALVAVPDAPIVVEVEESCSLCKHSARIEVRRSAWEDQGPSPRGRVIPFPDDP